MRNLLGKTILFIFFIIVFLNLNRYYFFKFCCFVNNSKSCLLILLLYGSLQKKNGICAKHSTCLMLCVTLSLSCSMNQKKLKKFFRNRGYYLRNCGCFFAQSQMLLEQLWMSFCANYFFCCFCLIYSCYKNISISFPEYSVTDVGESSQYFSRRKDMHKS